MRASWQRLHHGVPGQRFQERYERAHHARDRQHIVWRGFKVVLAVLLLVIGVIELVFPGPAVLFLFLGGTMLASEFRFAARFLDWTEVRVRQAAASVQAAWRRHKTKQRPVP